MTNNCFFQFGWLSVLTVVGLLTSCEMQEQEIAVSSVSINQSSVELVIGETAQLQATVLPSNANDKTIFWSTSKQSVASVSDSGLVSAVSEGSATINASAGGKTGSCTVVVIKGVIKIESIELDASDLSLVEGEEYHLKATVKPEDATDKALEWSSSNPKVAIVDNDGMVKAISAGSAAIIAASRDGKAASCSVTVTSKLAPSITLGSEHVSAISAVLRGKANHDSSVSSDLMVGFQYSKSPGILPSNSIIVEAEYSDAELNYTTAITGLEPSTTYYFRSFIRQNWQDSFGETMSFTTKDIDSMLETMAPSNIEATSVVLNAKLDLMDVKYDSLSYGFLWGISETSQNREIEGGVMTNNTYSSSLMSLSQGTQYYYKSYVKIDDYTIYGAIKSFTTVQLVTHVALNKSYLPLNEGDVETLTATVTPDNATDRTVTWSSSNESIASVDQNGNVTAKAKGEAVIQVTTNDNSNRYASCVIVVYRIDTPDAVDLGLPSGVKWASMNMGASTPEDYGMFYAWGETEPKSDYSYHTYKWMLDDINYTLTKYNSHASAGTVDNKTSLDSEDDVATIKLGDKWRIPTDEEWTELRTQCTWEWTSLNDVSGMHVIGPNGNSLFIPAAGNITDSNYSNSSHTVGYYWSSTLSDSSFYVWGIIIKWSGPQRYSDLLRWWGFSIRPVTE